MHALAALLTSIVVAGADRALFELGAPVRVVRLLLSAQVVRPPRLAAGAMCRHVDGDCVLGPAQRARGPPRLVTRSG